MVVLLVHDFDSLGFEHRQRLQRQKPSYLVFVGQIVVILVAVYNLVFLDPGFSLRAALKPGTH